MRKLYGTNQALVTEGGAPFGGSGLAATLEAPGIISVLSGRSDLSVAMGRGDHITLVPVVTGAAGTTVRMEIYRLRGPIGASGYLRTLALAIDLTASTLSTEDDQLCDGAAFVAGDTQYEASGNDINLPVEIRVPARSADGIFIRFKAAASGTPVTAANVFYSRSWMV